MNATAIIIARGGSKRIPRKNVRKFGGAPMIAHTIAAAIDSGVFESVCVSTDDQEIRSIARSFGAEVPFLRDPQLADDHTPSSMVTIDALNRLGIRSGSVAQLMPNCPLRDSDDVQASFEFFETGSTSVISASPYGFQPPRWALQVGVGGEAKRLFPDALTKRSQDLERLLCPTGAIWWSGVERLKEHGTFYSPGFRVFEMNWENAIDIDDERDWRLAEFLLIERERV